MSDRRPLIRTCPACGRDAEVTLTVAPAVVHLECHACGRVSTLERYPPN